MGRSQNENVNEPPFLQPPPVLLDTRSPNSAGRSITLLRGVSSSCPRRFDAGFVPTAKPDRDSIIVTRNSPLISAVSRKRSGDNNKPKKERNL